MQGGADLADFGAIDAALLGLFYMSYGVLGLIQLATLFNGKPMRFGVVLGASLVIAQGFGLIDGGEFCADGPSAIICNNGGRGLVGLGMAWVWTSLGVLAVFAMSRGLSRLASRNETAEPEAAPRPPLR